MSVVTKIATLLLLSLLLLAAGCGDETPDNGQVPEPELSEQLQEEETTQE